jgi:hypothetical protein
MTKYSVSKGNAKLLDDFRGDRIYGDMYIISKNTVPTYEVIISQLGDFCNCKGYINRGQCKHLNMVYKYREEHGL